MVKPEATLASREAAEAFFDGVIPEPVRTRLRQPPGTTIAPAAALERETDRLRRCLADLRAARRGQLDAVQRRWILAAWPGLLRRIQTRRRAARRLLAAAAPDR